MPKTIYTVTTLVNLPDYEIRTTSNPRCVGWFEKYQDAVEAVTKNLGDIWEQCYNYAVIETVYEGLYQTDVDYDLFKFDIKSKTYKQIDVPKQMQHYCSFGIG